MSTLLQKSQEILNEKNTKILPGNIKAGVQIFNIEGTYAGQSVNNQDKNITVNGTYTADNGYTGLGTVVVNVPSGSSSNLKTFRTVEEMQADTDKHEGDEAVVYRNGLGPAIQSSTITSCVFPSVVNINFDSENPITGEYMEYEEAHSSTSYYVSLDRTRYEFSNRSNLSITYTSADGKTYTRTDGGSEEISFTELIFLPWETWHDEFGQFTHIEDEYFGGMFQCELVEENNEEVLQYVPMNNQLEATASDVFEKTFYGTNGVQIGTLGSTAANSFDDSCAQAYVAIQDAYDNMEPIILTDNNRTINTNMYLIPTKTNGLPLIDTGNVTNMSMMFSSLSFVKSIPALNTNNVTNMSGAFFNILNLTTISNLNTSNVTDMSQMFYGCYNLTNVPNFDTSKVTSMYDMFDSCESLTTIPNFNTSNVLGMSQMFCFCSNLTSVPNFDTSNVISMGEAFSDCINLTTVPKFDTSNVEVMMYMFTSCDNLTNASLDNILQMCADSAVIGDKTLLDIGLSPEQANTCMNLSNYQNFVNAGWTTGF